MIWVQFTLAFVIGCMTGYFTLALTLDRFPVIDRTVNVVALANFCLTAAIALIFGQIFNNLQSTRVAQRELLNTYLKSASASLEASNAAFFSYASESPPGKTAYGKLINALRDLANAIHLLELVAKECRHNKATQSVSEMKQSYFEFKKAASGTLIPGRPVDSAARRAEQKSYRAMAHSFIKAAVQISTMRQSWR